jgi:hypothetical protein
LHNDPAFLERVVREQLRLSRPGERIFVFPEGNNIPSEGVQSGALEDGAATADAAELLPAKLRP